jgi:octaheme c-type cytochrome (tetrathionate reductase family)
MGQFGRLRLAIVALLVLGGSLLAAPPLREAAAASRSVAPQRPHLDHSAFFSDALATGPDVTRACLECHETAAREVMATAHFQWLGAEVKVPPTGKATRIGKKNLINNFCIGIQGNWASCTRCHAGYGWRDEHFDFTDPSLVDCLVCHDRSGAYLKSDAGLPAEGVDLRAAAQSVGVPGRENCGVCHHYGGGGLAVKHGDLDASLDNPDAFADVHMGGLDMLCIDCHGGHGHDIRGKAYSVSVDHRGGIACTDCHAAQPHGDARLDAHTGRVACQTCHIPTFANSIPTKMIWDWSQAGDDSRQDDTHHYLKIKGAFVYEKGVRPEYHWFNLSMDRYLVGDEVAAAGVTNINTPRGDRQDPQAQIWPFKVHLAKQPFDAGTRRILPPVTAGEGGYWHEFDWSQALALGARNVGLEFSGEVGFVDTRMFWPLSHMVAPKEAALQCRDCHAPAGRLDWQVLGYSADPMRTGGDSP